MDTRDWSLPGPTALVMDIAQVATYFRVKPKTIERRIARGQFPCGQGHPPTWTGADIAAFLQLRGRYSVIEEDKLGQNETEADE